MTHTLSPTFIGIDQDIELTGTTQIPFTATGKPAFRHGDQQVAPYDGQITVEVIDGRWAATMCMLDGHLVHEITGKPARKRTRVIFGLPARDSEHPDYLPPDWLVTFVAGLEDRLNGTEASGTPESAILAWFREHPRYVGKAVSLDDTEELAEWFTGLLADADERLYGTSTGGSLVTLRRTVKDSLGRVDWVALRGALLRL